MKRAARTGSIRALSKAWKVRFRCSCPLGKSRASWPRGVIHLGVTGSDLVREQLGEDEVAEVAKLGFGQADLVIAVPAVWIDVETVDDLTPRRRVPQGAWPPATDRDQVSPAGAGFPASARSCGLPAG